MTSTPNKLFVVAVGLLLIGLGFHGIRTGRVAGRIGSSERADNPTWLWFRVVFYIGLGVLALCYAWRREP